MSNKPKDCKSTSPTPHHSLTSPCKTQKAPPSTRKWTTPNLAIVLRGIPNNTRPRSRKRRPVVPTPATHEQHLQPTQAPQVRHPVVPTLEVQQQNNTNANKQQVWRHPVVANCLLTYKTTPKKSSTSC